MRYRAHPLIMFFIALINPCRKHNILNTAYEIFHTRCVKYYAHGEHVGIYFCLLSVL